MRGVLERRRLCGYRPAGDAQIWLHRRRSLRHRQRVDRLLRDVHQHDAGRRAARLRHAAAHVRLREPHRHGGARAQDRSGRVPPQERAAQRPSAGDRHDPQGCAARGHSRTRRRSPALERQSSIAAAARSNAAAALPSRSRPACRRPLRSPSSMSAPTAAPRFTSRPSTWAKAPTPAWRRSSARCSTCPPRSVRVVARDTDVTPYDMGTLGSRSLFHMGHAVRLAAEDARNKIDALRREVGEPEGSNTPVSGLFIKKYGMKAGNIVGSGSYKPDYVAPDHDTGAVARDHAVLDGRRLPAPRSRSTPRPAACASCQAHQRGRLRHAGQSAHRRDADFRRRPDAARLHHVREDESTTAARSPMPRWPITRSPDIGDLPDVMVNEAIDAYQHNAPFGAKGVGESATHAAVAGDRQRASTTRSACGLRNCR